MDVDCQKICVTETIITTGELDLTSKQNNDQLYICRICDIHYVSVIELTVHYVAHHDMHPCRKCMKLYACELQAHEHNKSDHSDEHFPCSECSETFLMEKTRNKHVADIHLKELCKFCESAIFHDKYQNHVSEVHRTQASAHSSVDIIRVIGDSEFYCELCTNRYHLDRLFPHYLYFHKISLRPLFDFIFKDDKILVTIHEFYSMTAASDKNRFCSICQAKYTMQAPKITHRIYCHGFVYCETCDNIFPSQYQYDKHLKNCSNCSTSTIEELCKIRKVENTQKQDDHYAVIQETQSEETVTHLFNDQFNCSFCAENLSDKAQHLNKLLEHYKITHGFSLLNIIKSLKPCPIEIGASEAQNYQNLKRSNDTNANYLEVYENGDDPNVNVAVDFDSKQIKLIYSSASDYDSNDSDDEKRCGPKRTTTKCSLCDFRTISKNIFATHMNQRHGFLPKESNNRCNACRKEFASHATLYRHYKTIHHKPNENNQKRFQCSFCDFACNKKSRIR